MLIVHYVYEQFDYDHMIGTYYYICFERQVFVLPFGSAVLCYVGLVLRLIWVFVLFKSLIVKIIPSHVIF